MTLRIHFSILILGLCAAGIGCDGDEDGSVAAGGAGGATSSSGGMGGDGVTLKWYTTCGDPVCDVASDDPGIDDCTIEAAGDPCTTDGVICEIVDDVCNANLVCAATNPNAGGC